MNLLITSKKRIPREKEQELMPTCRINPTLQGRTAILAMFAFHCWMPLALLAIEVDDLAGRSYEECEQVVEALVEERDAKIRKLLDIVNDGKNPPRNDIIYAIRLLGHYRAVEAVSPLVELISEPAGQRPIATEHLENGAVSLHFAPLVTTVGLKHHRKLSKEAHQALVRIGKPAVPALLDALCAEVDGQQTFLHALVEIEGASHAEYLLLETYINSSNPALPSSRLLSVLRKLRKWETISE